MPPIQEIRQQDFSIEDFLESEQQKDLLRFSTAGSVDDGKSTLIGRLLYDSRNVYEDQVRAVTRTTGASAKTSIDFAQLTDGLRAEREQGITIDVAYRFFATAKRKFIIADTPGHEQYTRNMATGASTADLAIILIDARKGILAQSRRHASIASLLGIRHIVAAINKMDLVNFSEEVFERHRAALSVLAAKLDIEEMLAIPISALDGDNVVTRSERTPWYDGPTLLEHLETVPTTAEESDAAFRFPVQRVIRPHQNFRGFAGQIAGGSVYVGDKVVVLPSGKTSRVESIVTFDGELGSASAPQSVTLTLEDEIDVSRGDLIAAAYSAPQPTTRLEASLVWLHADPLDGAKTYLLKHTSQTVKATVSLRHRTDIETLEDHAADSLGMNEIGVAVVEISRPVLVDPYRDNHATGSFILIDPATNATVGAGMVRARLAAEIEQHSTSAVIVLGSRQTLLQELEQRLLGQGYAVVNTRVTNRAVWESLLHAGVITLVACEDCESPSIAHLRRHEGLVFDSLDIHPQGEHSSAEEIERELHRRNIFPTTTEDAR